MSINSTYDKIGIPNPTTSDRLTVMNFLKQLFEKNTSKRTATFSASGTWVCPTGVTKIFVTASGGGGGGTGVNVSTVVAGSAGGITSIGALLSLTGGSGAGTSFPGNGGITSGTYAFNGGCEIYTATNVTRGGKGGDSVFGIGNNFPSTQNRAVGTGGSGAVAAGASSFGGGGGAGCVNQELTVVPSTSYSITIGGGGANGSGTADGQSGASGFVVIEWYE